MLASSRSCPVTKFLVNPSLSVIVAENLVASFSFIGILLDVLNLVRPYVPRVKSAFPPYSSVVGFLLITFIAPPVEFCPNSVPCGPLKTSIRSISTKSVCKENGDAIKIPSIWNATEGAAIAFWLVSLPTPLIEITVLYPSFLATVTPGTMPLKSTNEVIFFESRSESVNAETDCDISWILSLLFSAVTITSSI